MNDLRVLHIGTRPIGARDATGQTLASIFHDLVPSSVLQIVEKDAPADSQNVIELPPLATPLPSALHWLLAQLRASALPAPEVADESLNSAIAHVQGGAAARMRMQIRALSDLSPLRLPSATEREISAFRPQVIHSLLGSAKTMRLALVLSKRFDLPIVPHFMDDWMDGLYANRELGGWANQEAGRLLRRVVKRSPLCLVIGSAMGTELADRLDRTCIEVGNSVNLEHYAPPALSRPAHNRRRLVYVGGLHLGRAAVLVQLAEALRDAEILDWELVVFAPKGDGQRLLAMNPPVNITWGGEVEPIDVPQTLLSADTLLFVESSDPDLSRFTRLSVSTKVPQYLAADRPLVVIGPGDQASATELEKYGRRVHRLSTFEGPAIAELVQRLGDWVRDEAKFAKQPSSIPDKYNAAVAHGTFVAALHRAVEDHARLQQR